jgi:PIN domain nuclease of toxin-antitoxin system
LKLLFDTDALLWALTDSPKLSRKARGALANPAAEQFVSAASAMEIFTMHRLGRLPEAARLVKHWNRVMAPPGYTPLPITIAHAARAGALENPHGDPFDRILIAQALSEGLMLVSNETLFDDFGVERIW